MVSDVHDKEEEEPLAACFTHLREIQVDDGHDEAVEKSTAIELVVLDVGEQLPLAGGRAGAGEELGDGACRQDGQAVPVRDALDVRPQILVGHDGDLGAEGCAVGGTGAVEAAPAEVLGAGVAPEDLGQDALLHGVHVAGYLLDEPELLNVRSCRCGSRQALVIRANGC